MMMNRDDEFSDDRISQLPRKVIHHILMLLPLKDAAKTALMSTQWRRHWRTVPQLVFDDGFERITDLSAANKLILNIYKSLLAHDCPVSEFMLAVPGLTPCNEIDHIVLHLSCRGLQVLVLQFSRGQCQAYKVPSSLFTAVQLKHLELEGCLFMVPRWFVGFSVLTSLELTDVSLPSDFFEQFLPKCPLLEDLILLRCEGQAELELDAPRLKLFFYVGGLLKLPFKNALLLSVLRLSVHGLQKLDSIALFDSLLQELDVGSELLEVLGKGGDHLPSRLPSPLLRRLRTLNIEGRQIDQPAATTSVGSLLEAECDCGDGQCLQHLRVFEIEDSIGMSSELELVKFVLVMAPRLSRILIKSSTRLCSRKVTKLTKAVLRYKRVSEAEIVGDWNDDEEDD